MLIQKSKSSMQFVFLNDQSKKKYQIYKENLLH